VKSTFVAAVAFCCAVAANAASFTVTNTADFGPGSLRQAILDANTDANVDFVGFSIGTGTQTITVATPLPAITSPVVISGQSQDPVALAPPIIIENGGTAESGFVFLAGAASSSLSGLQIRGFNTADRAAVHIAGTNGVAVHGNYIGPITGGTANFYGVLIDTDGNGVGSSTVAGRNVISGNTADGVRVHGSVNIIEGNFIGVDPTGILPLGNGGSGVSLVGSGNTVGGTMAGAGNVVSANAAGVNIVGGGFIGAALNQVQGNLIGIGADGATFTPALGNTFGVVLFGGGAMSNVVGGSTAAARNVISNNIVGIDHQGGPGNRVIGNYVGTAPSGATAMPNFIGILVDDGLLLIGGMEAGEGNLISGNAEQGVWLVDGGATLQGNLIGLDHTGLVNLGNGLDGVRVNPGFVPVTIGGSAPGSRNVISGNGSNGILALGVRPNVRIVGNYLGLAADGTTPIPNAASGIRVHNSSGAIVGEPGAGNITSGNTAFGIEITGDAEHPSGANVAVSANRIGTSASGAAVANGMGGIRIEGLIPSTQIGGTGTDEGNVITDNSGPGIVVISSSRNVIRGNSIEDNSGLGIDLGGDGVTANDSGDADSGPNSLQNFPTLTGVGTSGAQTMIAGTLNSAPNTSFDLDFYASAAADPSGFGEGAQYLGTAQVMTDATGDATFNVNLAAGTAAGQFITATATTSVVPTATSELSNAIAAQAIGSLHLNASAYGAFENGTVTITVVRTGGTFGAVSVDYATSNGTATAGADYTASGGTLIFSDGQTTADFTVPILTDTLSEGSETFQVTLSNPGGGATLGTPAAATVTITDDDVIAIPALAPIALAALALLLAVIALQPLRLIE
jgi:parallel beta-helix repeat protein